MRLCIPLARLTVAAILLSLLTACASGGGSTTAYGSVNVEASSNRR